MSASTDSRTAARQCEGSTTTIQISRQERDVLRREMSCHAGQFDDLARMVRGEVDGPGLEERLSAEGTVAMLDAIGWELDGALDEYELPCSNEVKASLGELLEGAEDGVKDERDGAEAVVAVCKGLLGRVGFSKLEPVATR